MRRALALLATAYLMLWIPLGFAAELFSTLPSMGVRGWPAMAELIAHGAVAALAAGAGWTVWTGGQAARTLATAAIAAAAVAGVQSQFWTALPRNTAPSERIPLAVFSLGVSVVMLAVARRASAPPEFREG